MKSLMLAVVVVLTVGRLASASDTMTVELTVHSSPEGAAITGFQGVTPLVLLYPVEKHGCRTTAPLTATWASGAIETISLTLCGETGKRQVFTIARPGTAPGFEIDAQIAYQQALLAQMQAQQAMRPATAAAIGAAQSFAAALQVPVKRPVSCYSYYIGRSLQTWCQ